MNSESIKAKVELPLDWFSNPIDGDRHRIFMANLLGALTRCTPNVEVVEVPWGSDFADRVPPENGILFSYHSVGRVPGVWRLKEAPIPPLYSIDKSGHSGWSEIANSRSLQEQAKSFNLDAAVQIINHYREKFLATRLSKYPQTETQEALPERFVFIPLQVQADPVALYANINAITLLQEASRISAEEQVHVVVKRHPFCNSIGIEGCIAELSEGNPYFHLSSGNIHTLIQNSLSILTVNSGVGLEALVHGKPVYSCGKSEWQAASNEIRSVDDIRQAFRSDQPQMSDESKAYLGYLLSEYWVDSTDFGKIFERVKRCIERSLSPDSHEIQIQESRLAFQNVARDGDAERHLQQIKIDLDYMRTKTEGLESEVQRLTDALEVERRSSEEASRMLSESTDQVSFLKGVVEGLTSSLDEADGKLKAIKSRPFRSAIAVARGKIP